MNREAYRAAFDAVEFDADFQQRTVARLRQARREQEESPMQPKRTARSVLIAVAIAAVLLVSATAAVLLLSPSEAAAFADDATLAAAFSSDDAIIIDESVESGDYIYRLAGIVSGKGLSDFCEDVDQAQTYVVASRAYADGTPFEEAAIMDTTFTPLISGYKPWAVNTWTLGGGATAFVRDGIIYYIYEFDSIEMFADHTIYFAIYEGGSAPSVEIFNQLSDGTIEFNPDFEGAHALFTIPIDAAKADPVAAQRYVEENGLDY